MSVCSSLISVTLVRVGRDDDIVSVDFDLFWICWYFSNTLFCVFYILKISGMFVRESPSESWENL